MIPDAAWSHDRSPCESAHLNAWTLDLTALRSGGELRFDLSRAQLIVAESIASGPLPDAKIIDVVVVGNGDSIPQLHVTLRLGVDFIMDHWAYYGYTIAATAIKQLAGKPIQVPPPGTPAPAMRQVPILPLDDFGQKPFHGSDDPGGRTRMPRRRWTQNRLPRRHG